MKRCPIRGQDLYGGYCELTSKLKPILDEGSR